MSGFPVDNEQQFMPFIPLSFVLYPGDYQPSGYINVSSSLNIEIIYQPIGNSENKEIIQPPEQSLLKQGH